MSCWIKKGLAPFGIVLLACAIQCWAQQLTPIVQTHSGPVQGEILKTVYESKEYSAFKGIPLAEPPVGNLRFKPPIDPKPWTTVRSALNEGSVCIQAIKKADNTTGSEDCLYINVYTPHTKYEGVKKPVMVWIYGGGYSTGYSNYSLYGPDFFLEDDIVFVSFNYRVGAFGFLSAGHPDILGNAGLKDQSFALKWVRKNIANFGGDPDQVTIFGQSAGGSSVEYHILSEMSQGLFHRSISMSGTAIAPWSHNSPKLSLAAAFSVARGMGHNSRDKDDLVRFLKTAPAADIAIASARNSLMNMLFKPTTEDDSIGRPGDHFLTECPLKKIQRGNYSHMPHVLGFTKDEVLSNPTATKTTSDSSLFVEDVLEEIERVAPSDYGSVADWIDEIKKGISRKLTKIVSAVLFDGPADLAQRLYAKTNGGEPVYYYRVSYETEYALHKFGGNSENGVAHADDVGYIFHVSGLKIPQELDHPFTRFRKRMVKLWTNFAKYGNPTPRSVAGNNILGKLQWEDSRLKGKQLDINEAFELTSRMVDTATVKYERLWLFANPIVVGCKRRMSSFFDSLF